MRTLAEWVLKVALLSKHPAATFDDPAMNSEVDRFDAADPSLYAWMVSGDTPPTDLSVLASFESADIAQQHQHVLWIPRQMILENTTVVSRIVSLSVLDLSHVVLYHPLRSLTAPLPGDGSVEIYPGPAVGAQLQALTPRHPSDVRYVVSGSLELMPDVSPSQLPPLSVSFDHFDLVQAGLARAISA